MGGLEDRNKTPSSSQCRMGETVGAWLPGLCGAESHTGFRNSSRASDIADGLDKRGRPKSQSQLWVFCVFSNFSRWKKRWSLTKKRQKVERGIS